MTDNPTRFDPYAPADGATRMREMARAREAGAVAAIATPVGRSYEVMRYRDIVETARDTATFSNGGGPRHERRLPPLEYDPPEHGLYRAMLQPFFMPSRIRELEPRVRESAVSLLEPILAAGGADLAQGLAYPLPVYALCAQLGIDGGDWAAIKAWSEGSLLNDSPRVEERQWAEACHRHILAYARRLIDARLAAPRAVESDITSAMIAASGADGALDADFVAYTLRLFISAGHNSTTGALGNALLHLAENPADQSRLRAEPAAIPLAVEEMLRLYTPVQDMPRWATRDTAVGGCPIPAGARVGLLWASGNRDEAAFADAESCVLDRRPNRHLTFGSGVHMCLGAPMARMELRVVLEEILARTESFEVAGTVVRTPFRRFGVAALPVQVRARG